NVFFDTSQMRPGDRFPLILEQALAGCAVMLCIIGPAWLDARDAEGNRRIDNPADWVRLEIERALARRIRIVPILVGDARLPPRHDLPESLRPLLERNTLRLSGESFRHVVEGLERDLRPLVVIRRKRLALAGIA